MENQVAPEQPIKPTEQAPQDTATGVNIKENPSAQDFLFYNVMPKVSGKTTLVPATSKGMPASEPAQSQPNPILEMLKKYKLYLMLAAIIIIGGPIAYIVITKLAASQYKSQSVIIKQPTLAAIPSPTIIGVGSQNFTTPQAWRDKYFPGCTDQTVCGDNADPDHDGLNNLQEYKLGTDPNNPDSDQDGLADGDEINVFGSDPLKSHTANDSKFSDLDYVKGAYSFTSDAKMDSTEIKAVTAKMQAFGLHEPTLSTLGSLLNTLYNFSVPGSDNSTSTPAATTTSTPNSNQSSTSTAQTLDESLAAKQLRDTKRSDTFLNIEQGLVSYQSDNKTYPIDQDFPTMFAAIKPYLKVATNPTDPINQNQYVYSYISNADGSDFTLTFYSEVAAGPISKHAADAIKDVNNQTASVYDNQREMDLEDLRTALLLYSNANIAGNQTYVFPPKAKIATDLVPNYISAIPKDPQSGQDYDYEPSATFDAFTLKATLQAPPQGNTGYICNQVDDCKFY